MRLPKPTKRQAKHLARIGSVMAVGVLSVGSVSAQPVSAAPLFVAKAQSLAPAPVVAQPAAPIVQQEVIVEQSSGAEPAEVSSAPQVQTVRQTQKASGGGGGDVMGRIRACESGGRYNAVSGSGRYRGAYQFDYGTWAGVGGSGDPAAASPAEQDSRASALYARRGGSPWPVCSRR